MATRPKNNDWRIGKEIPLSLIFALIGQTVALVWWLSTLSAAVNAAAGQSIKTDGRVAAIEVQVNQFISTVTAPAAVNSQKVTSLESEVRELRLRVDTMQLEQARMSVGKNGK